MIRPQQRGRDAYDAEHTDTAHKGADRSRVPGTAHVLHSGQFAGGGLLVAPVAIQPSEVRNPTCGYRMAAERLPTRVDVGRDGRRPPAPQLMEVPSSSPRWQGRLPARTNQR